MSFPRAPHTFPPWLLPVVLATACGGGDDSTSAGSRRDGPADSGSILHLDAGDGSNGNGGDSGGGTNDAGGQPDSPASDSGTPDVRTDPPDRILREGMVGHATAVIDGDTLHLTVDGWYHRIRLQGVNAPECNKVLTPTEDGQTYVCSADQEYWGLNAQRALAEHLDGAEITVSCDRAPGQACPTDDFDRFLAFLETEEGDVGEWLARNGHAFSFTKFSSSRRALYCDAEDQAIEDGVGMWALGSRDDVLDRMNEETRDWYDDRDRRCAEAQGE